MPIAGISKNMPYPSPEPDTPVQGGVSPGKEELLFLAGVDTF
jgi:hypothetical protein